MIGSTVDSLAHYTQVWPVSERIERILYSEPTSDKGRPQMVRGSVPRGQEVKGRPQRGLGRWSGGQPQGGRRSRVLKGV